ncbi:MAG: hypothetical protein IT515_18965 [Burkholderiales bacterium]|nr:hypothetical protein [Burkholderiales bacterium]
MDRALSARVRSWRAQFLTFLGQDALRAPVCGRHRCEKFSAKIAARTAHDNGIA